MNFSALLFCQDEKTARLTTQILNELEFTVETSSEPFAAVKKLMGQHFDAVVVDCDNEQNASLLFKGARNSQLNQSSLAVAVVEGQAGVANAFRIGANLVLTKPINVEQAKGTLRVARGLLKKGGESGKASAAAAPVPSPAAVTPAASSTPTVAAAAPAPKPAPAPPTPRPVAPVEAVSKPVIPAPPPKAMAAPVASKPGTEDVLDVEPDRAQPAEEVLLDLDEHEPVSKPELKPSMRPSSLLEAEQVAVKPAVQRPVTSPTLSSGGVAAAPAPARTPEFEKVADPGTKPKLASPASSAPLEAPGLFSQRSSAPTFGGLDTAEAESSGGAVKYALIAVAVVALAAAGYFGYTKFHKPSSEPAPSEQVVTPPPAMPEAPSAIVTPAPEPAPKPKAAITEKLSAEVSSTSHKSEVARSESAKSEAEPEVVVKNFEEPRVVKANPSSVPKKKGSEAEVEAPSAMGAAPDDQSALSNIVSSAHANVPTAAPVPEMLKVSQGVTQGMLLKRVQPVYPHAALQMRIAGSVQLQAVIGKSGSISSVKVLSGDPILAKAAVDAVKQWRYKPYMLDGDAVDIQTQITVNFKLP
jgi:periplasmic protein TonB